MLLEDTFDNFLVSNISIQSYTDFSISGTINKNYYTEESKEAFDEHLYWKDLKPVCNNILKNHNVPTKMKFVFSLPHDRFDKILSLAQVNFSSENIGGLYFNLLYENNMIHIITATSLNIFTMDKTLDNYWDMSIKKFLSSYFDIEIL